LFEYLLGFGSSLGDRRALIEEGLRLLSQVEDSRIVAVSRIIETKPEGAAENLFLNGACVFQSPLEPENMLDRLLVIERECRRERTVRWGDRTLDLDILLVRLGQDPPKYLKVSSPSLEIPHPQMCKRMFVLEPSSEIAGDWIHPATGESVGQLFENMAKHCRSD
jgi:2-amino-4-hydroxy-6-hydroxymethyldihydropteridine diphosphokinase